jgi:hypothetical protein
MLYWLVYQELVISSIKRVVYQAKCLIPLDNTDFVFSTLLITNQLYNSFKFTTIKLSDQSRIKSHFTILAIFYLQFNFLLTT